MANHESPQTRPKGFYWVNAPHRVSWSTGNPMIASWCQNAWWFCGREVEMDDDEVVVVAGPLNAPREFPSTPSSHRHYPYGGEDAESV